MNHPKNILFIGLLQFLSNPANLKTYINNQLFTKKCHLLSEKLKLKKFVIKLTFCIHLTMLEANYLINLHLIFLIISLDIYPVSH